MFNNNVIKNFLKAKTPEGLQLLMLDNNAKRDSFFGYQIVFANGFWYAFYDYEASKFLQDKVTELELQRSAKER